MARRARNKRAFCEGCSNRGRSRDDPEDGVGGCEVHGCTLHLRAEVVRRAERGRFGIYECEGYHGEELPGKDDTIRASDQPGMER